LCAAVLHNAGGLARRLANYPIPRTNPRTLASHYTLLAPRTSHFTITLSATVSLANWKIGDQNYYRQFAELSQKNQNLLKAVRRSEVQLIGLQKSVRPRCY